MKVGLYFFLKNDKNQFLCLTKIILSILLYVYISQKIQVYIMENEKIFRSAIVTFLTGASIVFTVAFSYCALTGDCGALGLKMLGGAVVLLITGIIFLLRKR